MEQSTEQQPKRPRGFAAMNPEKQREIASRGGKSAQARGKAHRFTRDEAREAGRKGGSVVAAKPGHMAELGRRGGAKISVDRERMRELGRKGGAAAAAIPGHMVAIGRLSAEARRAKATERWWSHLATSAQRFHGLTRQMRPRPTEKG
jgi:general stress protein YciG